MSNVDEYASVIEQCNRVDPRWSAEHRARLAGRIFMTCLFQQALDAVTVARSMGRDVELVDAVVGDGFMVLYNGRVVHVERDKGQIVVSHTPVFPAHREAVAPEVQSETMVKQAKDVMRAALLFLLQ